MINTEQEIIDLKERIKRSSGDKRGRVKRKLTVLTNNVWLTKPWTLNNTQSIKKEMT